MCKLLVANWSRNCDEIHLLFSVHNYVMEHLLKVLQSFNIKNNNTCRHKIDLNLFKICKFAWIVTPFSFHMYPENETDITERVPKDTLYLDACLICVHPWILI